MAYLIILTSNHHLNPAPREQDDDSMNMSGGEEHHPGAEIEMNLLRKIGHLKLGEKLPQPFTAARRRRPAKQIQTMDDV